MGAKFASVRPQYDQFRPSNPMNQPFEAMGPVVDYEVPIRYSDMDLFGHVNNATYFSFLRRRGSLGSRRASPRSGTSRSTVCLSRAMKWTI